MKKFFYLIAAVAMVAFVACGGKKTQTTENAEAVDSVVVETVEVVDSTVVEVADSAVVETPAE